VVDYLQERFASKSIPLDLQETTTVQKGPVEHLLNKIEGDSSISCYEMAHCLHPTPAVSGFPVPESVKYILENEPYPRSLYAGYWGYLNEEGNGLLSVNLRCLHWQDKQARLYMGAGILPESDAETEWLETCRKSETLMNILQTLGWISPPSGILGE
ncbi:MAG: chorismate-binding protein, partial [Bacteroidota bacterium]